MMRTVYDCNAAEKGLLCTVLPSDNEDEPVTGSKEIPKYVTQIIKLFGDPDADICERPM